MLSALLCHGSGIGSNNAYRQAWENSSLATTVIYVYISKNVKMGQALHVLSHR